MTRVVLDDLAGHAFMLDLAGALERAGNDTVYAYCDTNLSPQAAFDAADVRVQAISTRRPFERFGIARRVVDNAWSRAHGFGDRPRFLYSGTLARKHSPEMLIDLARAVPDADIIVVSQGVGADWLRDEAAGEHVPNLTVLPFQPFPAVPDVLATGDVLIALLTPDAATHSVPSKVLSYLCAGRPILASIPADNAAARMIERAGAGLMVEPGDNDAFVIAAQKLLADNELRDRMGNAGRTFAEATFSSDRVAQQVHDIVTRTPLAR